ncbi:MAG TPA: hypothetical protein VG737_04415 [Cyclobacteriaceae bacterium]|nr:hypothetical protein [Cyclobacteriaceae bacterium]
MKDEDELESIIRQKDFASLTEKEKALVLQSIASEEEYEAIRKIELAMSDKSLRSTLDPDSRTLDVLKGRLKKQPAAFDWRTIFQVRIPAYVAALGLILISALFFAYQPQVPGENIVQQKVDSSVVRIDTVFITKTDTIVRDRIVYRQVNLTASPPTVDPATLVHQKQTTTSGVSMKEKEELNKLLVSGSE